MNNFSKKTFLTLFSGLIFFYSNAQHAIKLSLDCNKEINDPGDRYAHKKETVKWTIKDNRINAFQIIGKTADNPFEQPLPTGWQQKDIVVKVRNVNNLNDWNYTIICRTNGPSQPRPLDPKIAIDPATFDLQKILMFIGLIITSITALLFFNKSRVLARNLKKANKN